MTWLNTFTLWPGGWDLGTSIVVYILGASFWFGAVMEYDTEIGELLSKTQGKVHEPLRGWRTLGVCCGWPLLLVAGPALVGALLGALLSHVLVVRPVRWIKTPGIVAARLKIERDED
jgi:hypothetical protein